MSEVKNNSRVILAEHMDSVNKNRAKLQALYGENKLLDWDRTYFLTKYYCI